MNKYGWYRYEEKEVIEKKPIVWLKYYMKHTPNHTKTLGSIYNMSIEGHLKNEIVREIVNGDFRKCGIKRNISNLEYHRLNR